MVDRGLTRALHRMAAPRFRLVSFVIFPLWVVTAARRFRAAIGELGRYPCSSVFICG